MVFTPFLFQTEDIEKLKVTKAALIGSEMGSGKFLTISEPILTPKGWVANGNLNVGDKVIGSNGQAITVEDVFDQGEQDIVKITFSDDSYSRCSWDHLWTVSTPNWKFRNQPMQTFTTRELFDKGLTIANGNRKWYIPMVAAVEFSPRPMETIHPYTLGVLLGDGYLGKHTSVTTDNEIVDKMIIPNDCKITFSAHLTNNVSTYRINKMAKYLFSLGLNGKLSNKKFIPDNYKWGSIQTRIQVLQGLIDTDGYCKPNTTIVEYGTVSEQLSEDVKHIVQSLGGSVTITEKIPTYEYKGEKLEGQLFYRMILKLPEWLVPFTLERKLVNWIPRTKYAPSRAIVSIVPDGREEARCIRVSAEDNLYVTRDFIVTHNTHEGIALDELWNATGEKITLVIAPINTWESWRQKYADQSPTSAVVVYDRKKPQIFIDKLVAKQGDVFIMHWEGLHKWLAVLRKIKFAVVIADEAHRMNGRTTLQTKALKKLKTDHKLAMSGTASGDKPDGLWSILNWLYPDDMEFSSYWRFRQKYCAEEPIYKGGKDSGLTKISGPNMQTLPELHAKIEPFYVRHMKKEKCCEHHPDGIMAWLPDKTYDTLYVDLTPTQRRIYNEMLKEMVAWVGKHEDDAIIATMEMHKILRLQQATLATPELVQRQVRDKETGELVWRDFVNLTAPSPKINAVKEAILDAGDKQFVVWTSSKQAALITEQEFEKSNLSSRVLSGDTPQSQRSSLVSDFQSGKFQVVVGVIQAGGEGIDGLQQVCDTAFFLNRADSSWRNFQAEDRLLRPGQKNAVQIIDVIARDTINIERNGLLLKKWSDVKTMLGDGRI